MLVLPLEILVPVKLHFFTLNVKKVSQKTDIPTKIVKLSSDFFGNCICKNFNYCLDKGEFSCVLKNAGVVPVRKKKIKVIKQIIDQSAFFLVYLKFMEKLMCQQ